MKRLARIGLVALTISLAGPALAENRMALAWEAFDAGDYPTARTIWQSLADEDDGEAMVAVAGMAESGAGEPVNLRRARRLYAKATELGNPDAMQNLAVMLECGHGGDADLAQAKALYRKAAINGKSWAANQIQRLESVAGGKGSPC